MQNHLEIIKNSLNVHSHSKVLQDDLNDRELTWSSIHQETKVVFKAVIMIFLQMGIVLWYSFMKITKKE